MKRYSLYDSFGYDEDPDGKWVKQEDAAQMAFDLGWATGTTSKRNRELTESVEQLEKAVNELAVANAEVANLYMDMQVVVDAARKLVKAKGRYHTELSYKELAEALKALGDI